MLRLLPTGTVHKPLLSSCVQPQWTGAEALSSGLFMGALSSALIDRFIGFDDQLHPQRLSLGLGWPLSF